MNYFCQLLDCKWH